ncbi:MAG: hypothetical protein DIZ77_06405 [endosymbiont of Seepiophila jonesi]|uniref:Uncharacterized protein n=1 Tax=endosymbiont of Lamellibrachia luymesi TaxID=2200907 RepID=A0A370DZ90_9GAMM|nr:MAG: hypothetical protein DIZ79_04960 [endosymbiont of Lamellibrachia luymesi]RDH93175.1 MAG: hypothetical protein DIZ77_06405 [endosymbiont of Seepiophila jonesi]
MSDSAEVSIITRRIHETMPIRRQIQRLNSVNAMHMLGHVPVAVEHGLRADCFRQKGESLDDWRERLKALLRQLIKERDAA